MYINRADVIALLKSRCFAEKKGKGLVLSLSPTVIEEIQKMPIYTL